MAAAAAKIAKALIPKNANKSRLRTPPRRCAIQEPPTPRSSRSGSMDRQYRNYIQNRMVTCADAGRFRSSTNRIYYAGNAASKWNHFFHFCLHLRKQKITTLIVTFDTCFEADDHFLIRKRTLAVPIMNVRFGSIPVIVLSWSERQKSAKSGH